MTKKAAILHDLKSGKEVDMFKDVKRYGTSCRSRISEHKADGHEIDSRAIHESGALTYFMKEYVEARKKIEQILVNDNISLSTKTTYQDIYTIYKNKDDNYKFEDLDLREAVKMLENGYIVIPF